MQDLFYRDVYKRQIYSSSETSVAYTALCVPPSPIQTSLYLRLAALARLIESICAVSYTHLDVYKRQLP